MVEVTRHAAERLKERSGLNKKAIQRIAEKAYAEGVKLNETHGRLYKWCVSVLLATEKRMTLRLYGDKLYIFGGQVLVTIYQIPANLRNDMPAFVNKKLSGKTKSGSEQPEPQRVRAEDVKLGI